MTFNNFADFAASMGIKPRERAEKEKPCFKCG